MATPPVSAELVDDLVAANRILYREGVLDGFGHVSARSGRDAARFLLARSMAPGLVTAADILQFDERGEPFDPDGRTLYLERFIHSEIYRFRPDVQAIVHSHSPAVIPFGVTSAALRPVFHMSSFLGKGTPVFEIRDSAGDASDMLVRTPALGAALARALGPSSVALMRGHGDVVVGGSLPEAVFRAIYTEVNAALQAAALRLGGGEVAFLSEGEAAASAATNAGVISRAWELWIEKAMGGRR